MNILIPNLGEGADSGFVVTILVKEGDRVKKNQTILELENEKAVAPIPSPYEGVVDKILVKVGDKVSVGQAVIALAGEGQAKVKDTGAGVSKDISAPVKPKSDVLSGRAAPAGGSDDYTYTSLSGSPPPASPSVREMAAQLDIDLTKVRGTGDGGRIKVEDLKNYITRLKSAASKSDETKSIRPPEEKIDFAKWGPVKKIPLSLLRKTIAGRMSSAWATIPHVTQYDEADITALMDLKKRLSADSEKKGVRLTLMPFIMKAVTAALKKYPVFNASFDAEGSELIQKEYYHLGIAVDTEAGLIVPVLKDADRKDLVEISKELEGLAQKARERKLTRDELKGGTFTISNLGSFGVGAFSPIINKPEVGILGVGKAKNTPVYMNDKIEKRLMLPLSLSYDHRVIDGAQGARFIRDVVEGLENYSV